MTEPDPTEPPDFMATFDCGCTLPVTLPPDAALAPSDRGKGHRTPVHGPCPECAARIAGVVITPSIAEQSVPPHMILHVTGRLFRLFVDGRCACIRCWGGKPPPPKTPHMLWVT